MIESKSDDASIFRNSLSIKSKRISKDASVYIFKNRRSKTSCDESNLSKNLGFDKISTFDFRKLF